MPTLLEHSIGVLTDLVKCQSPEDTLSFFGIQVPACFPKTGQMSYIPANA